MARIYEFHLRNRNVFWCAIGGLPCRLNWLEMVSTKPLLNIYVQHASYRFHRSFIAQAPLCTIAFVAVYFVLDMPEKNDAHWKEKVKRVDFLGALTLVLAVVSLLLGLDNGSNIGWTELWAIVPLILAPCLFLAFILVEVWCASNPFAPGHVIFDGNLFPCFVINFFGMGCHFGTLFFAPLFLQAVSGWDATSSGSILVPSLAVSVVASIGAGAILKRTDRFRTLAICSYMLAPPGVALILVGMASKSPWLIGIGLAIPTIGVSAGEYSMLEIII